MGLINTANNIPPLTRVLTNTKIDKNNCWNYQGSHNNKGNGYCQFSIKNKPIYVHRFMYEYYYGELNPSLVIDHLCKNSRCVNPLHLEQVTQKQNCNRGSVGSNMSQITHCPQGHEYTKENTYYYTSKKGLISRQCRTCGRERQIDYQKRKRLDG